MSKTAVVDNHGGSVIWMHMPMKNEMETESMSVILSIVDDTAIKGTTLAAC